MCNGQCYSGHVACPCNAQCGCNADSKTCTGQRTTNTARVFSWNRIPAATNYITADDIIQLRTFLQQEQNARSTPSPAYVNGAYAHPGSCTIQTTSWTGTVSASNVILSTTFTQLVTLLNTLKTRATSQHATMTSANAVNINIGDNVTAAYHNSLRAILIESYKQCICASKVNCNCQLYCACQYYSTCSCNGAVCACNGQCSCVTYNCGCNGY
jgi:hypothetical protein